jgi:cytochrome c-type biogenesis protein CcmH/NrfG
VVRPASEEIESLSQLHERGLLSAEEFERAKAAAIQKSMIAHRAKSILPSYTKLLLLLAASIALAVTVVLLLGPR